MRGAFGDSDAEDGASDVGLEAKVVEAAEGLLEAGGIAFYGPAERYLSAALPGTVYAGFPRSWWTTVFVSWGLVGDAHDVETWERGGVPYS